MIDLEREVRLGRIFMPYATERRLKIHAQGHRFVHYTSAANAMAILTDRKLWLRNATCMSDYFEIRHGYELLLQFFSQPEKRRIFCEAVNRCQNGLGIEVLQLFDQWWLNNIPFRTYISCISEHADSEDQHGRLSMWSAFGVSGPRAAIVIKPPPLNSASGLKVLLSQVAYFAYEKVEEQIQLVVSNILGNIAFLHTVNREELRNHLFYMLITAAVSLKHEGFAEEKEWRLIYLPDLNRSDLIQEEIEVIHGVPQVVHKIPLLDSPSDDVVGVSIQALVDRVIIGPSSYPIAMHAAFAKALRDVGIVDGNTRVVISGIPLRT